MKLYTYYRSSSAYRVRIALNHKHIPYEHYAVNLLEREQQGAEYLAHNPQGLVPALETDDGELITQSIAIIEWLDAIYPDIPLLPSHELQRAKVRALVNIIACDIQPLNNLRVLNFLKIELEISDGQKNDWYQHWICTGFSALESQLSETGFCYGEAVSMADVYLIPQVYNALRFNTDMEAYPNITRIYAACNELNAFKAAHPDQQPDKR
ncbi:MAG: maleylacetoacetate isomerase [Pseudomonadales bacterium]